MCVQESGELIPRAWKQRLSGVKRRLSVLKTRHRRTLVALLVVLIVVACGLFVVVDPFRTKFQYDVPLNDVAPGGLTVYFGELENTNVTILLTNNTDRALLVDIELFNRSSSFETGYELLHSFPDMNRFWVCGNGQMRSLVAVIYSPVVHLLVVEGRNLTTTVRSDKSATFIDRGPEYNADLEIYVQQIGVCTLVFDEPVGLPDSRVRVYCSEYPTSPVSSVAFLYVDLPSDAEGKLHVDEDKVVFHALDGWWYRGENDYSTQLAPPRFHLYVGCGADMTHAWLYD